MEISKILTADFLDIVFEGRNKDYGAYDLRKTYASRLRMSIGVMTSLVLLLVAGVIFGNDNKDMLTTRTIDIPDTELTKLEPPKEEIIVPPPPPKKVEPVQVMERRNTTIVIVKEEDIPENEKPPLNDELDNAVISLVNKDGVKFDGIAPPVADAAEKGIVAHPKKRNDDSLFISVEIPSSYPGGSVQWARFLNRNLARAYPQEAADNGIQGKVVIQFIVDREGNVSDVKAIAGPAELHDAAVKVIQKSGRWIPAEQNGSKVKSLKSQPIIFSIGEQ